MPLWLIGLLIVLVLLAGCVLLSWLLLREAFGVDVRED